MNKVKLILVMIFLLVVTGIAYKLKHQQEIPKPHVQADPEEFPQPPTAEEKKPEPKVEVQPVEPRFDRFPKVRTVNRPDIGKILQDIDSHMPAGHHYSFKNLTTWGHETTHGINAEIRNKHPDATKVNGFYCLQDRAVVIYEPKTTMKKVAVKIPSALRGPSYQLYLVQQTSGWNDRPLYLCDEWTAYTNGSEVGRELNYQGWYYELLQAHNFNVYCIYMAMVVKQECPDYDDTQLKAFMMWNIERTFRLAAPYNPKTAVMLAPVGGDKEDGKPTHPHPLPIGGDEDPTKDALEYVHIVRTSPEAEELRTFARQYFGKEWCKKVYGF